MKFDDLRALAAQHPTTFVRFVLPDQSHIPAHAHITEVGHVVKKYIDCGGQIGRAESVVLQTHVGDDFDHRLRSDRFAKILSLGDRVVPATDLEVEVEYDCCVVAQYPITETHVTGEHLEIILGRHTTQCRARQRQQLEPANASCAKGASCC